MTENDDQMDLTVTLEEIPRTKSPKSFTPNNKKHKKSKRKKSNFWGIMKYVFPLQVYKVMVNNGTKSWFIFRRYNEFHTLHEKVSTYKARLHSYKLPFYYAAIFNNFNNLYLYAPFILDKYVHDFICTGFA